MLSAKSRIDVLIPVHNGAPTIAAAIDSIRTQTIGDIRIVVVDDGSTDATPGILADLARSDARITVVTKINGGLVDALNAGLALCTAEFVARHDADDIAYPHRFALQLEYLDAHPDCVAVSSFARQIDKDGRPSGLAVFPPTEWADPAWIPCKEPYLLHPFMMVRRSALAVIDGYRHAYHAEDADLCWRLQDVGKLHIIPQFLGDYRVHALSITGRSALNGRLSAINSQLAAVSVRRRRGHEPDLNFTKSAVEQMSAAVTMAGMFQVGRRGLDGPESRYLEAAFAAKFLELASYKPYEPDLEDCRFIGAVLIPLDSELPQANRTWIRRLRAKSSARLLVKGRFRSAMALLSVGILMETVARFAAHFVAMCLPSRVHSAIWSVRCRLRERKLQRGSSIA
jgi:glycosyltransferase involved in cell wall biosynthesis